MVMRTRRVLRPIALDDQPMFEADKINDEDADGNLPSPFHRGEPMIAQQTPKRFFRVGCFGAERSGVGACGWFYRTMGREVRNEVCVFSA